jgi:hypothetical protein
VGDFTFVYTFQGKGNFHRCYTTWGNVYTFKGKGNFDHNYTSWGTAFAVNSFKGNLHVTGSYGSYLEDDFYSTSKGTFGFDFYVDYHKHFVNYTNS